MERTDKKVWLSFSPTFCGIIVVLVFLYWVFFHAMVTNYDIWWHLRTGKIILSGFFPKKEIFSCTAAGKPWILHEWGSEVIFYLLYSKFGVTGLVLLRAVVIAIATGLFFTTLTGISTGPILSAAITLCFVFCLGYAGVLARPQMFTILLFIVVLRLYLFSRELGSDRGLFWLFPVFLLWINLHGGFIIGFIFLGLCVVGETVDNLIAEGGVFADRQKRTNRLLAICAGSFVLCLANPNTYHGLLYPFAYHGETSIPLYSVAEWHPASWVNAKEFFFVLLGLFLMVWLARPKISFARIVVLLFFMFYTFKFHRVGIFFILCTLLFMARDIESWLLRFLEKWSGRGSGPVSRTEEKLLSYISAKGSFFKGTGENGGMNLFVFTFLAVFCSMAAFGYLNSVVPFGVSWNRFPSGNIKVLARYMPGGKVFNQYRWGGLLIYRFPEKKVFMDGRVDVYGRSLLSEYEKAINLEPGWRRILEKYGVDHILVGKDTVMGRLLASVDSSWKAISTDKTSILFVKKKSGSSHKKGGAQR